MNFNAVWTIYVFEMRRFFRTITQSLISPVLSTSLYFVVFGAAIGSRIQEVEGVSYGAFIVPGLIMLSVMTQATSNASFGIYFPKFIGTIYELLSAPISFLEVVAGYVGAAATKALFIGIVILITAFFFVDIQIVHPFAMMLFLVLTCVSFALLGFIIGIWADNFEKLQLILLLLNNHAAARLANDHPVQSSRLPDQRIPLVVLWGSRCGDWRVSLCYRTVYWHLPRDHLVDFPYRLADQAVTLACDSQRPK